MLLPPKFNPTFKFSDGAKLFFTGASIGPLVDSLHNQCLLTYDRAPITIEPNMPSLTLVGPINLSLGEMPVSQNLDSISQSITHSSESILEVYNSDPIFCSSWYIPPLLGIAYVVLGWILPHLIQQIIDATTEFTSSSLSSYKNQIFSVGKTIFNDAPLTPSLPNIENLRKRALLAVASTAVIIKLSDYLQTHPGVGIFLADKLSHTLEFLGVSNVEIVQGSANLLVMASAALAQWYFLDGTATALLTASITSIGGPLSELPFVANGFWHYIPAAADYFPLSGMNFQSLGFVEKIFESVLGLDYQDLALSSITGPCYFAVTMDAIALGRWFNSSAEYRK